MNHPRTDLAIKRHRFAAARYTLRLANRTGQHKGYYLRRYQAALDELRLATARVEGYLAGLRETH